MPTFGTGPGYAYLHGLAVERAGACKDAADALEPPHEARFLPWLLVCEKEAMVVEAVAQHYLQDAWARAPREARRSP